MSCSFQVEVKCGNSVVLSTGLADLRAVWEETSFQLDKLQCEDVCAESEKKYIANFEGLPWKLKFGDYGVPQVIKRKNPESSILDVRYA